MRWQERAACLGDPDDAWLGDTLTVDLATTCHGCPVRLECLTEAMPRDIRWDAGIWGGTTPKQRSDIRHKTVSVTDVWHRLDMMVREAHDGRFFDLAFTKPLPSRETARSEVGRGDRREDG